MFNLNPILYAEDNDNDVILLEMAFRRAAPEVSLQIVSDGMEVVSYLKGEDKYADRTAFPIPQFLLLDLKMPKMTGIEVLEWVRSQPAHRHIPVVMLTASLERKDQERCYASGANSFLVKPSNIEELVIMAGLVATYWMQWNQSTHVESIRA